MKGKTISARWTDWTKTPGEFVWAKIACITFGLSVIGLPIHLWFLSGPARTIGLLMLIICACITETILFWRSQKVPTVWWWFWVHTLIVVVVLVAEISSYMVSAIWGV